jgi:hypothetical protein
MLIAQITDLHIGFDRGNSHELNVRRLNMVIDELNEMSPRPELLLVTGDLVENGDDVDAYQHAHALVGRWQGPKIWAVGNHDGRDEFKGYWWSDDSSSLAHLRLDERGVPRFTLVDETADPLGVEITPYPRPGERNPVVRLGITRIGGGPTRWVDLGAHASAEPLVVDVAWTPRGEVAYQVQRECLDSVDACLKQAGAGPRHVVKVTIFMTDISERPLINPLRIDYFGEHRPASTLVEVSKLVDPRLKVEIEAVAYVDD